MEQRIAAVVCMQSYGVMPGRAWRLPISALSWRGEGVNDHYMARVQLKYICEFDGSEGLAALVSDVNRLVSLSDSYYRLESALESPASTISDFSTLLSSDPDLCARL